MDLPYILNTFLVTLSSAVNPLIYGVMNKSFRTNYLKLLRCTYCADLKLL